MRKMWVSLLVAVVAVVALAFAVLAWQRSILFPRHLVPRGGPPPPAETIVVWLDAGGARTEAWFLPPLTATAGPHPVLVFAHGNGELIDFWPPAFEVARRWGLAVLLVEYPGYGRSGGRPTERSITSAMVAAYDWAVAQPRMDRARVIGYGRSVGGGAACALARSRPLSALILESSPASVRGEAQRLGVPGFLVRDPFDNVEVLRDFGGPVLILHGERDEIIPVANAHAIAAAARAADLHLLPCGHNDCPRPWAEIERFLVAHGLRD